MRRVKGEGSIYQQKDGSWIARFRYGMRPNGKPYEKKRMARTKTEAKRKLDQLKKELEQEERRMTKGYDNIKVEKYFDMFLEWKKSQLADSSYRRLESIINTHIKPRFNRLNMCHVTSDKIQECLNEKFDAGLSQSSVKKIYEAFNGCYRFAIARRDITPADNPMLSVNMIASKKFEPTRKEPRYLDEKEKKIFEAEALRKFRTGRYAHIHGPALIFMMNTGLREGEMSGLTWDNVDLKQSLININQSVQTVKRKDKYVTEIRKDTKYNSERYVPLNDRAKEMLEEMKGIYPENKSGTVICGTRKNNILPPTELTKAFNKICVSCDITENMEGVGAHCLRHTFATTLFEHNIDAKVISELLGHSGIAVTLNTYVSVTNKMKAKIVEIPKI